MASTPPNLIANGNINPSRFVMLDVANDHECLISTLNARLIGVSQAGADYPPLSDIVLTNWAAQAGDSIQLYTIGDICLLEAGDTITTGDWLRSDAAGRGIPILLVGVVTQQYGAIALEDGVVGEHIRVQVHIGSEKP